MTQSLNVLVIAGDPWWARMACALAEHAGHRTGTTDDEPGRVLRLLRRERPDAVLALVDAEGCTELAGALAARCRRDGTAVVLATRDPTALAARCESLPETALQRVAIVDAWSEPAGIVRALEHAAGTRLHVVSPAGPGATAAKQRS